MLLQTNSYIVPKEKRAEHARLLRRFRQTLHRLGCDHFECYEQVGANWTNGESSGRFVQLMRFRDRKHQLSVQAAERSDAQAQQVIADFCEMVNFPYQQQQGLFAVGFYTSVLPVGSRAMRAMEAALDPEADDARPALPGEEGNIDETTDGQPADPAAAETATAGNGAVVEPSAAPNAAEESLDAENSDEPQAYEAFGEEHTEPDTEARQESEPFSRP